jgi:hypothetical protein
VVRRNSEGKDRYHEPSINNDKTKTVKKIKINVTKVPCESDNTLKNLAGLRPSLAELNLDYKK